MLRVRFGLKILNISVSDGIMGVFCRIIFAFTIFGGVFCVCKWNKREIVG